MTPRGTCTERERQGHAHHQPPPETAWHTDTHPRLTQHTLAGVDRKADARLRATRGLRGPARFQGCRLEHLTPAAPPADTVLSEAGAHGGVLGPVLRRPRQEEPGPCGRSCCDSSHPLPSRAAVAASKSPLFISTPFSQDHGCTSPKRVVRVAARVRRPPSRGHAQARTRASPGHPCFSSV